jgi:hypothetical protein
MIQEGCPHLAPSEIKTMRGPIFLPQSASEEEESPEAVCSFFGVEAPKRRQTLPRRQKACTCFCSPVKIGRSNLTTQLNLTTKLNLSTLMVKA